MRSQHARIAEGGRLVIPAEMRRTLNLPVGASVVLQVTDGALVVRPLEQAIREVQEIARRHAVPGVSEVDAFIAERRAEARRE